MDDARAWAREMHTGSVEQACPPLSAFRTRLVRARMNAVYARAHRVHCAHARLPPWLVACLHVRLRVQVSVSKKRAVPAADTALKRARAADGIPHSPHRADSSSAAPVAAASGSEAAASAAAAETLSESHFAPLVRRHAGVLGLASLVGAFPYTVPDWMPAIVVELATHISDAVPVKGTVKKAMGEFWRTHQDMWPIFKLMFDEQQLHTLTEMLASPTYYS